MADATETAKVDPFKPLVELAPELFASEGALWHEFMEALGVTRLCETHSTETKCPEAGCKALLAFRAYIGAHKQCEGWRRWRNRAIKAELRAYLKKLAQAKGAAAVAALRKEADRDYALLGLFNRYEEYLGGKGPKPEV